MTIKRSCSTGMTLIELMVVLALISMVIGISSAFFTQFNQRLALRSAARRISVVLRAARNFALEPQASSQVEINTEKGTITALGAKIVGYWHFEKEAALGAFGLKAHIQNAALTVGKIGSSLQLNGQSEVDLGSFARFNTQQGYSLSGWIFPNGPFPKSTAVIWQIGSGISLALRQNNTLVFQESGRILFLDSYAPLYRWTHLRMVNNGKLVTIYVNGVVAEITFLNKKTKIISPEHLVLGSGYYGKLDEVSLAAMLPLEQYTLPADAAFQEAPKQITFDSNGNLDSLQHLSPINILLAAKKKQIKLPIIHVSLMGNITLEEP